MIREAARASARWVLTGLLALVVSGCGGNPVDPTFPESTAYAGSLGIDLTQMIRKTSGVYYQTRTAGTGAGVDSTTRVSGDLKGWTPDGVQFTSLRLTAQAVSGLLPGLEDGMIGMQKGEIRVMVLPSHLGYGARPPEGSGVPPNSVLVFEMKLNELSLPPG